jgi:hypothetical protein
VCYGVGEVAYACYDESCYVAESEGEEVGGGDGVETFGSYVCSWVWVVRVFALVEAVLFRSDL